jgi:hypothetical protein
MLTPISPSGGEAERRQPGRLPPLSLSGPAFAPALQCARRQRRLFSAKLLGIILV